jgi:peroxiredoxin
MKKFASLIVIVALLAVILIYAFREQLEQAAYDKLTSNMFVESDEDSFDPGPALGSHFPGVRATWQGRHIQLLQEFYGPRGLAFVATRSAEWCPYCMRQMIQLQEYKAEFDQAGIGLVAMTYDDPELQQAFVDKHDIEYPILHDVDALSFRTLGILNEEYRAGDPDYGIPHPGMLVIDTRGKVVGKLFLESYSVRVDSKASLEFAKKVLGISEGVSQ